MVHEETLRLQGADNFRSLKGMVARCGRRIGGDVLLRADQLHSLTAEDWQALQRLGLRTVCDLRSAGERDRYPNRVPDPAIEQLHLEVLGDVRADPRVAAMLADNPQAEDAQDMMLEVYRQLPSLLAPLLPTLFTLFTQGNGSVLIHCTAGKDRTGVLPIVARGITKLVKELGLHLADRRGGLGRHKFVDVAGHESEAEQRRSVPVVGGGVRQDVRDHLSG